MSARRRSALPSVVGAVAVAVVVVLALAVSQGGLRPFASPHPAVDVSSSQASRAFLDGYVDPDGRMETERLQAERVRLGNTCMSLSD